MGSLVHLCFDHWDLQGVSELHCFYQWPSQSWAAFVALLFTSCFFIFMYSLPEISQIRRLTKKGYLKYQWCTNQVYPHIILNFIAFQGQETLTLTVQLTWTSYKLIGQRLNSIISEVFSNLKDSVILWNQTQGIPPSGNQLKEHKAWILHFFSALETLGCNQVLSGFSSGGI